MAGLRSRRAGTIFGFTGHRRVAEHRGDNPVVGWRHWINHRIIIRCSTSSRDDGVPQHDATAASPRENKNKHAALRVVESAAL